FKKREIKRVTMKERRTLVWSMAVVVIALVVCTVSGNVANPKYSCCTEVY
ncbi:hypothetical protein DNTS_006097, partial [Danionella cerebrum]